MRPASALLYGTIVVFSLIGRFVTAATNPEAVLVEIGSEQVTIGEFQAYLELLRPHADFDALSAQARQRELDEYLERRLLAIRARELGLDASPQPRRQIEYFSDGILADALRQQMVASVDVSKREIRAYYKDNKDEFRVPPRLLLEHVIYSHPASAKRAKDKLNGGSSYDDLIAERTRDPNLVYSRRGWLTPELLIAEISEPALALAPGDVSDVLQSSYGHHVLRLAEREAAVVRPLKEVRGQIIEKLQRQKSTANHADTIAEIRRAYGVKVHLETLRSQD